MKAPFFWTPQKITIGIFLFSLFVLAVIGFYIYVGLVQFYSGGGTINK
jgi:hypothetical protein